ncbi:adenylate/guanylate cyclase domain-containing protein [Thomasclavelia cocleata]|uniref:adenylate/guanylate cyclase domain-containing protein n=1 Tax=Thomasclavelia cocleata TaxID=69824 RepID=UPI0025903905|nr:adenylate/guanylate cyclase domain-containing protein [Thomasclavelia cocleata]
MGKGEIGQLKKELTDIINLKIDTDDIDYIPNEQEISKKKKAKNLQCSVMFVDMRNSTKMQDKNGRKNMIKIYKMFAKLVTKAVEENCGNVMQIVGDGLLCLFVNKDMINSGQHAINAVRSINTYVKEAYNPLVETNWKIDCGMGICSGHILITRIGTRGKNKCCQLAFPSSITNYASKCCDNAGNNEVIFDEKTYEQLDSHDKKYSIDTIIDGYDGKFYRMQDIIWKI